MTTTLQELGWASRVIRDAVKDRSYRATPIGLVVGRYIRWKRSAWGARPSTLRDYEAILAVLCLDHADLELRDFEPPIGGERLEEWIDHRWGDRAPATRAKVTSIAKDFFVWAVVNGLMVGDPTTRLRRPRQPDPERKMLSEADCEQIIRSCTRARDLIAASLIITFGLRRGEIARLQLGHYQDGMLNIDGKGGRRREIPMVDPILRIALEAYITDRKAANPQWRGEHLLYPEKWARGGPDEGLVLIWSAPDREISGSGIHNWWARLLHRAGVPHLRMHAGRHRALTNVWRKTGDLELVRQLAGHKYATTTANIYIHAQTDDLARKLGKALED